MRSLYLLPLLLLFVAACSVDTAGLLPVGTTPDGGPVDDADLPMGDSSTQVDASTDAQVADASEDAAMEDAGPVGQCTTEGELVCDNRTLKTCVNGSWALQRCAYDCGGTPARCSELVPSNIGGALGFEAVEGTLDLSSDPERPVWVIDTTNAGQIIAYGQAGVMSQEVRRKGTNLRDGFRYFELEGASVDAPRLGVLVLDELYVPANTTLIAQGARALVLYVRGTANIQGTVTASANDIIPGAAGGAGGIGGNNPEPGEGPGGFPGGFKSGLPETVGGGGGGSFGSLGGSGGSSEGGNPGASYGDATLIPLFAGAGGGGGSGKGPSGGAGGHGGGAIQISAGVGITISGTVEANGGGGHGGEAAGGGGGGGSGGAVLLESATVTITGRVSANGGGGGAGSGPTAGDDGDAYSVPAAGGTSLAGRSGGAGNQEDGTAGDGAGSDVGGGGGGGAGRIRINTYLGTETYSGLVIPSEASLLSTVGNVMTILPN